MASPTPHHQTSRERLIRSYLKAMERGDLAGVLSCFQQDAVIISPVYGLEHPARFYERLFADTIETSLSIHSIYASTQDETLWIAHFTYEWRRKSAPTIQTNLIDLFEFAEDDHRLKRLRIVFDTDARP